MRRILPLVLFLSIYFLIDAGMVAAQSIRPMVINAAGGSKNMGYTTIDWSVGEMPLVNTMSNSVVVITNGFLQPFTENPAETDDGGIFTPDEIRVFPNPATNYIEINFLTQQKGTKHYKLFNGIGQLILQKQFTSYGLGRIERIEMQNMPATEYFLQILLEPDAGSVAKKGGYKIIKLR